MSDLAPEQRFLPISIAPKDGTRILGRNSYGAERETWWGKASHIAFRGWCYIPEGGDVEDVTLWDPDGWRDL